jgi:7-cyano-7-deazaguanine synthase
MPKHVVLLSGGLDSTVVCALACFRDGPHEVVALTIGYGQHHINELHYARQFAERYGIPRFQAIVDPSPWKLLPLMTGATRTDVPLYAMKTGGVSDAFLPGRNVAFLAVALAVAGIQGATEIWIGANADDEAGFPDCRRPFFWAWQQMASHALDRSMHLHTPLLECSKRQVVALARAMAVDIDATWSCYRPQSRRGLGAVPCGRCDACRLRADALETA